MTKKQHKIQKRNRHLCKEMPYLRPRQVFFYEDFGKELNHKYMWINGEHDLPQGWLKLFLQMCRDIKQPLKDSGLSNTFFFDQIKEKYGTMRCYNNGCTKEVQSIISKYEYMSKYVCQKCGKPATRQTYGWISSYCDDCFNGNKYLRDCNYEELKFDKKNEEVDCSDEWNRLMGE